MKGAESKGQRHICSLVGRAPALSTVMVPARGRWLSQAGLTCLLVGAVGIGGDSSAFLTFVVGFLALCLMNVEYKNERMRKQQTISKED